MKKRIYAIILSMTMSLALVAVQTPMIVRADEPTENQEEDIDDVEDDDQDDVDEDEVEDEVDEEDVDEEDVDEAEEEEIVDEEEIIDDCELEEEELLNPLGNLPEEQQEQQEMEYYGFTKITSFADLTENQILYYSTAVLTQDDVMKEMPNGTGVLVFTGTNDHINTVCSNDGVFTYRNYSVPNVLGATVDVKKSATGFDNCPQGVLWFDGQQVHYSCLWGGSGDVYFTNTIPEGASEAVTTYYNLYTCKERPLDSVPDYVPAETPEPAPYIPPHEHTYEWVELVDMDGYFLGQEQYKCTGCGHIAESRTLNYTCPVIDETMDEVTKIENILAADPLADAADTTIVKDVGGYYFVNRALAEAFTKNGKITLEYTFLYDHILYKLVIPAGFDLTATLNEEGYAGFMWIAAQPGTTLEEIGTYVYN